MRELVSEAIYIAVSLFTLVFSLGPRTLPLVTLMWTVTLTTLGLVMAREVANRISLRLVTASPVHRTPEDDEEYTNFIARMLGAALALAIAIVPALIFQNSLAGEISLMVSIMAVGIIVGQLGKRGWLWTARYTLAIGLLVLTILVVKSLIY